uniref:MAK10-like protein n=1 Tax=Tanacetum cinerariifolium TaxID=118510 RepID=A0A6L2K9X6_TANCI|nr:MAK10-like protein [Tanacetum cinerariifolium]
MSRDVLTVGSTMRIPLLYRGEYSQWVERFMNYLKEQTDGEAMINSIKNGDQLLPRVTQVSIAGTTLTEQPPLKDKSMWSDQEKRIAKDLWDALARYMLGSEYGEQDRKAAVLYEYKTFKATEGELLLDTYIRYLQYAKIMRQNKNLMDINIDALYNILKQNQGDVNDFMGSKKKNVVITSDPLDLIAEKTKVSKSKEKVFVSSDSEGSEADNFSELKKITALLENAFNRRKFYSKPTNNNLRTSSTSQSSNKKQEFVKSYDKKVEKKANEKKRDISKVKCYNCKKEGHFAKDCKKAKEINANIVFMAQIEKVLFDLEASSSSADKKISKELVLKIQEAKDLRPTLYDEKVIGLGYTLMFLTHSDEALEIKKFKRSRENKIEFAYDYGNLNASYVNEKIKFKDDYFQEIINPDFEKIDSPFQQTSSLKPYVSNGILEKIIIYLEDEVVNLLEKEKENLETIVSLKSKGVESSENLSFESENPSENDCLVVEKECDKKENSKVIAPGTFKLNVSQCVSSILMSKSSCDSNNVEIKLKGKRLKKKSSKQNVKQVDHDVSRANNDFVYFPDLDTFSSVRRPKNIGVIWKKNESSNTSNVVLSTVSVSNMNKNVKRYSRKDLLACNNSHLGETSSASVCNDAMNVSCNYRMNDLLDDNNFFIFDDVNVKISPVSKMPFRKKHHDSMQVRSKSNMIKSLPRTMHKWLLKLQPLAEPVAKWFPRVKPQIDKISKTPNSPRPIYKWNSKAYKTFISISTGLIPPKIGTGKGAQGTEAAVPPKKTTATSKKKRPKNKVSISDESSDEESDEQEERLIRKPRDEKFKDIPWKSTDDDETEDDDEEDESDDDKSINIKETDDERLDTYDEDLVMGKAKKVAEKAILASIKSQVPSVVEDYLGSSLPDEFKKSIVSLFYLFCTSFLLISMGDKNSIRTLRDYSKPSHEGYRNTIELPKGNNVVSLRSDTIRLVKNGCSFQGLWSEDPNQHLKDFLKLMDSLDLDVANRERRRLCLFQFSLRDQASN